MEFVQSDLSTTGICSIRFTYRVHEGGCIGRTKAELPVWRAKYITKDAIFYFYFHFLTHSVLLIQIGYCSKKNKNVLYWLMYEVFSSPFDLLWNRISGFQTWFPFAMLLKVYHQICVPESWYICINFFPHLINLNCRRIARYLSNSAPMIQILYWKLLEEWNLIVIMWT